MIQTSNLIKMPKLKIKNLKIRIILWIKSNHRPLNLNYWRVLQIKLRLITIMQQCQKKKMPKRWWMLINLQIHWISNLKTKVIINRVLVKNHQFQNRVLNLLKKIQQRYRVNQNKTKKLNLLQSLQRKK
jgi:hypothetical protein